MEFKELIVTILGYICLLLLVYLDYSINCFEYLGYYELMFIYCILEIIFFLIFLIFYVFYFQFIKQYKNVYLSILVLLFLIWEFVSIVFY